MAHVHAKKEPITCRPADLLKPEWNALRADALALKGCNGSDEDVLTFAMFPQVAPKFFSTREQGPKNLGKDPSQAAPAPAAAAAKSGSAEAQPSGPAKYAVTINGQTHNVTVAAAR
jgi:methylmalonyl-CoA carboxyltransferase 5S subunit